VITEMNDTRFNGATLHTLSLSGERSRFVRRSAEGEGWGEGGLESKVHSVDRICAPSPRPSPLAKRRESNDRCRPRERGTISIALARSAVSVALMLALSAPAIAQTATAPATQPVATRPATTTQPANELAARVTTELQRILTNFQIRVEFPGGGVAFVLPDGSSGAVCVGLADRENNIPMRPDHRLPAGSIGKTFIAALALQMVQTGELKLDQPISTWLGERDWFARLPNANAITVRTLMNHTSGVPDHVQSGGAEFRKALHDQPDKVWKPDELIAFVLDKPAVSEAGKGWSYADTNYVLLGMIIEQVAKKSVYDLAAARFIKPLSLRDTLPQDRRDLPGLACGYMKPGQSLIEIDDDKPRTLGEDGRFFINPQFEWCGGGFISTPRDLAKWCHALYHGDVLEQNTREMMLDGMLTNVGRGHRYGLGVQIRPTSQGVTFGHGGHFPGSMSEMAYYADHGFALAIMVNSDHHTWPSTLMKCLNECADAIINEMAK
jgi:D-alanyl-D-alanine carboxypeptidase